MTYYALLLPIIFLYSILLWWSLTKSTSHQKLIDSINLVKISTFWVLSLFALTITFLNTISNAPIVELVVLIGILLAITLFFLKDRIIMSKLFKDFTVKNIDETINVLVTMLQFCESKTLHNEITILRVIKTHIYNCQDQSCPCSINNNKFKDEEDNNAAVQSQSNNENNEDGQININEVNLQVNKQIVESSEDNLFTNSTFNKKLQNLKTLIAIYEYQMKNTQVPFKLCLFLIFIDSRTFSQYYRSFFELNKIKKFCQLKGLKYDFSYLQMMIINEINSREQALGIEQFNLDELMYVEARIQEYKHLVYEEAILVERFWVQLKHEEFKIKELLENGKKIANNYIMLKYLYEEILENKQDSRDTVILSINLFSNVLNFELEAQKSNYILKNLQQQHKIRNINNYGTKHENDGLFIVSMNQSKKNKIIFCNKISCKMLGFSKEKLLRKNINELMPEKIACIHDSFVEAFMQKNKFRRSENIMNRIWMLTNDGCFVTVGINLQLNVSEKFGITFICYIKQTEEISFHTFQTTLKNSYQFLTNEAGFVTYVSSTFQNRFLDQRASNVVNEENKINADQFFVNLYKFSEEELEKGVSTYLKTNQLSLYTIHDLDNANQVEELIEVQIAKTKHNYSNFFIKEFIFIEKAPVGLASLNFEFQKQRQNCFQQQETGNEIENEQQLDFQQDSNGSSTSGTSNSTNNEFRQIKGIIDFTTIPTNLLNFRRILIIFFFVLIGTSIALLLFNEIFSQNFIDSITQIKKSVYVTQIFAQLRLSYVMLLQIVNEKYKPVISAEEDFRINKEFFLAYLQSLSDTQNSIQSSINTFNSDLQNYVNSKNVILYEFQDDGSIRSQNFTILIALLQYASICQNFAPLTFKDFQTNFRNFTMRSKLVQPNLLQKAAYFLIINGKIYFKFQKFLNIGDGSIYDISNQISVFAINQSADNENKSKLIILVISITCALVTLVSTAFVVPVTFIIDSEEEHTASQWFQISMESKDKIIRNINEFISHLQNERLEEKKIANFYESKNQQVLEESRNIQDQSISELIRSENNLAISRLTDSQIQQTNQEQRQLDEDKSFEAQITQNNQLFNRIMNIEVENQKCKEENQEQLKQTQLTQTKKLFYKRKLRKSILTISYSLLITVFYISSYFFCSSIFDSSQRSFNYTTSQQKRGSCATTHFFKTIQKGNQNQSFYLNFGKISDFDHLTKQCFVYEEQMKDIATSPPNQLESVQIQMQALNSKQVCNIVYNTTNQSTKCKAYYNGILMKGYYQSKMDVLYYLISTNLKFLSASNSSRTNEFLDSLQFDMVLTQFIYLQQQFIVDFDTYLFNLMQNAILSYLGNQIAGIISAFGVFILFLFVSLIIALKLIMNGMKEIVFRSQILIKIIPYQDLMNIKNKKIEKKKQ